MGHLGNNAKELRDWLYMLRKDRESIVMVPRGRICLGRFLLVLAVLVSHTRAKNHSPLAFPQLAKCLKIGFGNMTDRPSPRTDEWWMAKLDLKRHFFRSNIGVHTIIRMLWIHQSLELNKKVSGKKEFKAIFFQSLWTVQFPNHLVVPRQFHQFEDPYRISQVNPSLRLPLCKYWEIVKLQSHIWIVRFKSYSHQLWSWFSVWIEEKC